jgi:hypothetical protein
MVKLCSCEAGTLAIVVIASDLRLETTLPRVVESVLAQEPDEFLVVASGIQEAGFPFLNVEPMLRTTIDALVKRDAGFVATESDNICYLTDDHRLAPDFVKNFRDRYKNGAWDILVPTRYAIRGQKIYPLAVGHPDQWFPKPYCSGHAGIYKRDVLRKLPWSAGPHHRNWDALHSRLLVDRGAQLVFAGEDLAVEDIEPNAEPWL